MDEPVQQPENHLDPDEVIVRRMERMERIAREDEAKLRQHLENLRLARLAEERDAQDK